MSATARCSADRREVALVAVAEGAVLASLQPSADDGSRVAALLHRNWRDAGQDDGFAVRPRTRTMSPIANTSG